MEINVFRFVDGARKATGLAVIIDVFRAFSTACYVMDRNARQIIMVGELDEAYEMKKKFPGAILMGERKERKPVGFDFGNSPLAIEDIDFSGKTVIHTTTAGTQGLVNANMAKDVITGSFVNAEAVIRYIQYMKPEELSLVCMGYRAGTNADEDELFATYVQNRIHGLESNYEEMVAVMREGSGSRFFNNETQEHAPSGDFYLCTALNRFDFVLRAERRSKNMITLEQINI